MCLFHFFGALGAAVASVTAETVIAVIRLIIARRELSPARVLRDSVHYFIAGGIMFVMLLPMGRMLVPSIWKTVVMVLSGAVFYLLVLLLQRDEFFMSNVKKLLKALPFFRLLL